MSSPFVADVAHFLTKIKCYITYNIRYLSIFILVIHYSCVFFCAATPWPRPMQIFSVANSSSTVLSVLPIKDKSSEALPRDMWFRLEQVKQCRKIYPSSVAFQRLGKSGIKSYSKLKDRARGE